MLYRVSFRVSQDVHVLLASQLYCMRMCNLSGVLFMLVAYFAPSPPYLSVVTKSILGGKHLY